MLLLLLLNDMRLPHALNLILMTSALIPQTGHFIKDEDGDANGDHCQDSIQLPFRSYLAGISLRGQHGGGWIDQWMNK